MVACDFSQRVGKIEEIPVAMDALTTLTTSSVGRWAQDAPPPTDPWKWGGAIGAWILSPAQEDTLILTNLNPINPKPLNPKALNSNPKALIPKPYNPKV